MFHMTDDNLLGTSHLRTVCLYMSFRLYICQPEFSPILIHARLTDLVQQGDGVKMMEMTVGRRPDVIKVEQD